MGLVERTGWGLYQGAMAAGLMAAAPILLALRGRHYLQTLPGRLGLRDAPAADPGAVWIHAVSVGEVGVAATLAGALEDDLPLVVTTVTPTGQEQARKRFVGSARRVAYLPFDLGFAVEKFFRHHRPRLLILVEGDYWPLVLRAARRHGVPVVVVNGRVGDRSARRLARFARWSRRLFFDAVTLFAVQTEADRERLLAAGAAPDRVHVTGNLKFDTGPPAGKPELEAAVEALADGRPILIAGSTMAGEDDAVLDAFETLGGGERALLVLVPRHPERWDDVARRIERRGFESLRRSAMAVETTDQETTDQETTDQETTDQETTDQETTAPETTEQKATSHGRPDVLLLDSLGELAALYRLARGAFIGGTLVPTGGHNPLEPATFGVPVVVGPSMDNFRDMARRFDEVEAWSRVEDAAGLGAVWATWLDDRGRAQQLGARAQQLLEDNRGAVARTSTLLEPFLGRARTTDFSPTPPGTAAR